MAENNQMMNPHVADYSKCESDSLEALLADAAGKRGWQPIETAPKDGELLLCQQGWVFVGSWNDVFNEWLPWESDRAMAPTHWMPLPEPPKT